MTANLTKNNRTKPNRTKTNARHQANRRRVQYLAEQQHGICVGIDVGVNTGYAKAENGKLCEVTSGSIIEIMDKLRYLHETCTAFGKPLKVYIEDARKRKWFGNSGREKLQGVGSVKRDSGIWEEFCLHYGIAFELVAPKDNNTKLDHETFVKITGWAGRTNEHSRDSAMLVFGRGS